MFKHGGSEGETRETALQGRKVVGSLGPIMKGRSVSMEVKRDLRNTVIVQTLTYASETWAWTESQRSRVLAVEMSYLRSACGVSRMYGVMKVCMRVLECVIWVKGRSVEWWKK